MEIKSDFLIIGSGIAGLSLAIKAARLGSVSIVTKKEKSESNTNYAQGGIAAVMDKTDSFEEHIKDTLTCGAGLCHRDVVEFVVREAPERIQELIEWGVNFTRSEESPDLFDLGQEGGHHRRRVLHAQDLTGREIERALHERVAALKNVNIYENHIGIDLIVHRDATGDSLGCLGAYVLDIEKDEIHTFRARYTILSTGGAGKVYLITTNPDIATGDGIAMAYRAGAEIANMEFIQFHPTCLFHPEAKAFLISEAVRGEGGILRLKNGATFMEQYHPMKSLAPRDVVAKAIDNEIKKSGDEYVLLDITHHSRSFLQERFPNIYDKCLEYGYDMALEPIPVAPAAHYICGGVLVDHFGKTSIDNLYACGEVSCTGLHGANRLASNSLLEALIYSHRTFMKISESFHQTQMSTVVIHPWDPLDSSESDDTIVVTNNWEEIRRCMWNYVGIVRSDKRLERALRRIEMIQKEIHEYYWNYKVTKDLIELRNITTVAKLIVQSARSRKESRGLHYTMDYPEMDNTYLKDTILTKNQKKDGGTPAL
ncbi:MAG: L-aspartate oxidase [Smithellaceae bacterium]|jgi:L-aspartate oxidase|nr:L-aspartate oxidase [Syntrophaceae bacterium]